MFDIKILATGSRGNCALIDNSLMIDTGIKVREFKEFSDNVKYIFLTHSHKDHTKIEILNHILKHRPNLLRKGLHFNFDTLGKIKSKNEVVFDQLDLENNLIDSSFNKVFSTSDNFYRIEAFELFHDVENYGFIITNKFGEKLIYATDTYSLENAPDVKYNYILIEGNYNEDTVVEHLESGDPALIDRAVRNLRHLSVQKFENFVQSHSFEDTVVYQLHESDTFGFKSNVGADFETLVIKGLKNGQVNIQEKQG